MTDWPKLYKAAAFVYGQIFPWWQRAYDEARKKVTDTKRRIHWTSLSKDDIWKRVGSEWQDFTGGLTPLHRMDGKGWQAAAAAIGESISRASLPPAVDIMERVSAWGLAIRAEKIRRGALGERPHKLTVKSGKSIVGSLREFIAQLNEILDDQETSVPGDDKTVGPLRGGPLYAAAQDLEKHFRKGKLPDDWDAWRQLLLVTDEDRPLELSKRQILTAYQLLKQLRRWAKKILRRKRTEKLRDPITIVRMASLAHLDTQTLRNWGTVGRPRPAVPHRGRKPAVYSYAALRKWFVRNRPDLETQIPVDYTEAMKRLG